MPVISFDIVPLSKEQKIELAKEFTETAAKVTGIAEEFFYVYFNESPPENVAVGGKLLSQKE